MTFFSALRVALAALFVHRGRSALTSLGIVIGVGAVIAMVSAADSARRKLDERLDNVGKTLIVIKAGAPTQNGALADVKPFSNEDVTAIRKQLGHLLVGVAEVQITLRTASTRTTAWNTMIVGTSPDMQAVRTWELAHGRFFNNEDIKKQAPVCVLGKTVREKLFPDTPNPVGQSIRIDKLYLVVVGVLAPKGRSPTGGDQDDQIFVPLSTQQRKIVGEERVNLVLTGVTDLSRQDEIKEKIKKVLHDKRRIGDRSDDFDVSSVQELTELAVVLTQTMQLLIICIASVSLVVGGIGIMNIMLVSVTERTREIGIRMAVGATPRDVLLQFLIEAVALSLVGGLLGILLGGGVALALSWISGWPLHIDPLMVLLAFGVSGAVGVFFGYYPAWKASRLDPIESLRYE